MMLCAQCAPNNGTGYTCPPNGPHIACMAPACGRRLPNRRGELGVHMSCTSRPPVVFFFDAPALTTHGSWRRSPGEVCSHVYCQLYDGHCRALNAATNYQAFAGTCRRPEPSHVHPAAHARARLGAAWGDGRVRERFPGDSSRPAGGLPRQRLRAEKYADPLLQTPPPVRSTHRRLTSTRSSRPTVLTDYLQAKNITVAQVFRAVLPKLDDGTYTFCTLVSSYCRGLCQTPGPHHGLRMDPPTQPPCRCRTLPPSSRRRWCACRARPRSLQTCATFTAATSPPPSCRVRATESPARVADLTWCLLSPMGDVGIQPRSRSGPAATTDGAAGRSRTQPTPATASATTTLCEKTKTKKMKKKRGLGLV